MTFKWEIKYREFNTHMKQGGTYSLKGQCIDITPNNFQEIMKDIIKLKLGKFGKLTLIDCQVVRPLKLSQQKLQHLLRADCILRDMYSNTSKTDGCVYKVFTKNF